MNVVVVGAGRMGLPLACVFADNGAHTTVCDVNAALVDLIHTGQCPYEEEPGLAEVLGKTHQAGRLDATVNTAGAVSKADVVVVIVPAHLTPDRDIDYSILKAASVNVGKGLQRGTLVTYETTVSVGGTRRQLVPVLEKHSGLKAGADFCVAFSPERVKARLVLARLRETPKIIGGFDDASRTRALNFYKQYLGAPVDDVGTLEAAELAKLVGMLYRDVNIALANELAEFSEMMDIDFERVREVSNRDGEANLLTPGIGVGGHCTPVYPYFLTRESNRIGVAQRLAEAAREINDAQPRRHVARLAQAWQTLEDRRVHILGLSFRPEVKVDTFSTAYTVRDELLQHKALVTLQDPYYTDEEIRRAGFEPARVGDGALDAVILNTAHRAFADPDFAQWHEAGIEAVVDGRGLWDPEQAHRAGVLYLGVGKGARRVPATHPSAAVCVER